MSNERRQNENEEKNQNGAHTFFVFYDGSGIHGLFVATNGGSLCVRRWC